MVTIHEIKRKCDQMFGTPQNPEWCKVIYDDFVIPNMKIRNKKGRFDILLDDRFLFSFEDIESCYNAVGLASNAMAIASGYSHVGAENKEKPFAPKFMRLDDDAL